MGWYTDYGYNKNPFVYDALRASDDLINYEKERDNLLYWVESGNMALIQGPAASGKTRLAKEIVRTFGGKGKVVYVDGEKKSKHLDIAHLLIRSQNTGRKLFNRMPKDMILVLDNAKALSNNAYKRLQYYFDQDYLKSIVFITRNKEELDLPVSVGDRIGDRIIETKPLSKKKAFYLVNERLGYDPLFSEKILEEIQKKSKGLVELLENCEKVGEYMARRDLIRATKVVVRKALQEGFK